MRSRPPARRNGLVRVPEVWVKEVVAAVQRILDHRGHGIIRLQLSRDAFPYAKLRDALPATFALAVGYNHQQRASGGFGWTQEVGGPYVVFGFGGLNSSTIRHELRHFVQFLLTCAVHKLSPVSIAAWERFRSGAPAGQIERGARASLRPGDEWLSAQREAVEAGVPRERGEEIRHHIDTDVEFHTNIGNIADELIEDWVRQNEKLYEGEIYAAIRTSVRGHPEFAQHQERSPARFRNAVGLLTNEVMRRLKAHGLLYERPARRAPVHKPPVPAGRPVPARTAPQGIEVRAGPDDRGRPAFWIYRGGVKTGRYAYSEAKALAISARAG